MRKVFERLGLIQIDSVNVLVRSHYLPLFSRLGPYDRSLLDRFAYRDHEAFEYWGHEASLIQARFQPLLRWRMAGEHRWAGMRRSPRSGPTSSRRSMRLVLAEGLAGSGDLDAARAQEGAVVGLEREQGGAGAPLLRRPIGRHPPGELRAGLLRSRRWSIPADVLAAPTPSEREAMVGLLEHSARAHGVGTAKDLGDYFRLPIKAVRPLLEEMADDGIVDRVEVEGWKQPTYVHPDAHLPRWVKAAALVSPFDSVMWERDRVERVFDFNYRIEIYVPKPKRVYGYYVLPFLLGDRYVARVDLKADRAASALLVQSAFAEDGVDHLEVAERLAEELRTMAGWLDLDDVVVKDRGDLAPTLQLFV